MRTKTTTSTPVDVEDLGESNVSREAAGERGIRIKLRPAATTTFHIGGKGFRRYVVRNGLLTVTAKRVLGKSQTKAVVKEKEWGHTSEVTEAIKPFTIGEKIPYRQVIRARLRRLKEHLTATTHAPEVSLGERVAGICAHPGLRFAERLGARLQALLAISDEEQPEQAPPALASVKSLVAFLAAHPELVYPSVVLTQEGNVRVQWGGGPNKHFAVEFLGDGDVRFVIFAPDPRHPYKTIRVSGSATVDSVMRLAEPYDVRSWTDELFVGADAQ